MEAPLLQETRGRESHDAAADDRAVAAGALHPFVDGELRGAPRKGDPGAAVPVIVDDYFIAKLLRAHDEAGRAKRAESDDRADDPVGRHVDAREPEGRGEQRRAPHGARREDCRGHAKPRSSRHQHARLSPPPLYFTGAAIDPSRLPIRISVEL